MTPSDAIREIDPDLVGDTVRRHLNGAYHTRARLLQLLVHRPEITTTEIADDIERSSSTVRHYLGLLRKEGLPGLFGPLPNATKLTFRQAGAIVVRGSIWSV